MTTYAPIIEWNAADENAVVEEFLKRPPIERQADDSARAVLADIRENGNAAVLKYASQFDNTELTPETLRVTAEEIAAAELEVDEDFKKAALEAHKRIVRYGKAGMHDDWQIDTPRGGMLGERWIPVPRVGAYIPGGAAPLASTSLHTVTLAQVAGVPEIVACTPCKDGVVNPYVLYSLNLAGATEIYKIGGIQSIGAMAYGTETIKKVCKIVGPGGPYVTAAKRLVYGDVSLDMVAGPSEIAVLCDHTANPAHVAADLLSQAEHGSGSEKTLLVTTCPEVAKAAQLEVVKQAHERNRTEAILKVLEHGTIIALVPNLEDGVELCNRFAPEHMELIVEDPAPWAEKVLYAGALFIGPYTPEPVGDFVAGPSHVLPTGGTATFFSGLTVDDFRRRMSLVQFTKEDLEDTVHVTDAFGRVETLDAHARSANIRLD
jgi:histidinol dehydrogenase